MPREDDKLPTDPTAPIDPLDEEPKKPLGPLSEEDAKKLEEEEKKIEEIMKRNMDAAYTSVVIDPSRQGYFGFVKGIIEKTDEDFATKADKLRAYLESQDADEDEKEKEEVIGAHNTKDHAFKRFRESILKVLGPKKEKDPDKDDAKDEDEKDEEKEKEQDVLRSAFLGIIIDKFKFLGDAVPTDDKGKTKDVNSLIKSLKDLADEKSSEALGLKGFFQAQYDEHRIETGDQLLAAKNKGLTEVEAAKLTMAQDVAAKVAQIAAIAALAGTGAILPAAILAGIMYWWHSRKGNKKGAELTEEEKLAAQEAEAALKAAAGDNPDLLRNIDDILNNEPKDDKDKPIDPKDAEKEKEAQEKAKQAELAKAAQEVKTLEEEYKKLYKQLGLEIEGAKERLELAEKKLQEAAQKGTAKVQTTEELQKSADEELAKAALAKSEQGGKDAAKEIEDAKQKPQDPEAPKLDKEALGAKIGAEMLARQALGPDAKAKEMEGKKDETPAPPVTPTSPAPKNPAREGDDMPKEGTVQRILREREAAEKAAKEGNAGKPKGGGGRGGRGGGSDDGV